MEVRSIYWIITRWKRVVVISGGDKKAWRVVEPRADRLLLFRSDRVLHKVSTARKQRVSLTVSFLGFYQ